MKRSRLNPMSKKRRASLGERERVRLEVFQRDGGCQLAWAVSAIPACAGPLTVHHLLKASQGGPYHPENLVVLCAFHNGWVEDNPKHAYEFGLVIRRGDPRPWEAA